MQIKMCQKCHKQGKQCIKTEKIVIFTDSDLFVRRLVLACLSLLETAMWACSTCPHHLISPVQTRWKEALVAWQIAPSNCPPKDTCLAVTQMSPYLILIIFRTINLLAISPLSLLNNSPPFPVSRQCVFRHHPIP